MMDIYMLLVLAVSYGAILLFVRWCNEQTSKGGRRG
ncbi:hypothetical protein WG8_1359 [Paenibacillus sp. Aloe-11]|nr:hypothetical protein WG8_1359 [Paenibacillus sp. Aloe-11]